MNVRILLLFLVASLFFSACGSPPRPIARLEVDTIAEEKVPLALPNPDPVKLNTIGWFIVTPETVEDVLAELERDGNDGVLFAITDEGYESLALNMVAIRAFLLKQKKIIRLYREYYESDEAVRTGTTPALTK